MTHSGATSRHSNRPAETIFPLAQALHMRINQDYADIEAGSLAKHPDDAISGATYTVGSNGRTAITGSGGTQSVLYIVSAQMGLLLNLTDANSVVQEVEQ